MAIYIFLKMYIFYVILNKYKVTYNIRNATKINDFWIKGKIIKIFTCISNGIIKFNFMI